MLEFFEMVGSALRELVVRYVVRPLVSGLVDLIADGLAWLAGKLGSWLDGAVADGADPDSAVLALGTHLHDAMVVAAGRLELAVLNADPSVVRAEIAATFERLGAVPAV